MLIYFIHHFLCLLCVLLFCYYSLSLIEVTNHLTHEFHLDVFQLQGMLLRVEVDAGLSSAIATIDKATLTLPGYLQISSVNGNGNGVPMVNGSKITVENVSTSRNLQLTIKAKKLDFANQDAYGKVVIGNNGSIKMDGYFDLGIEANVTGVPTSALSIGANVTVNDITLKSATGIFDPEINISSLGDVSVTGVPDFLDRKSVV